MPSHNSRVDRKERFAGILENPYVSMIQRDILDYGRTRGLAGVLQALNVTKVLDVGCGLGENSRLFPAAYTGIDNSFSRVTFAANYYRESRFLLADALEMPVKPGAFDMVMLIDTSHHLADEQFLSVLKQMRAASCRWVLVSDPVLFEGQSALSRFFYSLDRGARFRDAGQMAGILQQCPGLKLAMTEAFTTFPGLYRHGVFLLELC